jgi:predicted TPR repeat methyltransferase
MKINGLEIRFPKDSDNLDQDEEWFEIKREGETTRLRLHDYNKIFKYPGLYEGVVYDHLKCNSPEVVCGLLNKELGGWMEDQEELHVLDLGAGNGMVGEQLQEYAEIDTLVGVDIFPEAKAATERDRPGLYDHYCVTDLCEKQGVKKIANMGVDYNLMVTVAALGYGDIPVEAFLNAYNVLEEGSLVAFNIKDRFMSDQDDTGYNDTIQSMCQDSFEVLHTQKYQHRLSLAGDPLEYVAVVGKKIAEADPASCLADLA